MKLHLIIVIKSIILILLVSCDTQNLNKEYNCNGTSLKFNDLDRSFVVGGDDLSANKDFYMNQVIIFGKFYKNSNETSIAIFNKINKKLELKDSIKTQIIQCVQVN